MKREDIFKSLEQLLADKKAGYPPNCNEGYVAKDGKCVPVEEKSESKKNDNDKEKNGDDKKKNGDDKKKNGDDKKKKNGNPFDKKNGNPFDKKKKKE
jgi:hypothetical protein